MNLKGLSHAICDDARRRAPREACGIVLDGPNGARVRPAENVAPVPTLGFEIPLPWLLAQLRHGTLRAIYHSHPDGPGNLSPTDRARFATPDGPLWPGVELWVVGLRDGAVDLGRHLWDSGRLEFRRLPAEAP